MNALTKAVYEMLAADSAIVAMVGRFDGMPSIHTASPIRPSAVSDEQITQAFPMVVFEAINSDVPFGSKVSGGREIVFDVAAFAEQTGSIMVVVDLIERVRAVLTAEGLDTRPLLTVPGFQTVLVEIVGGPTPSDSDRVYARVLSVRVIIEEV